MLEPNSELESIFERAVKLAIKNQHEYVTLEHFLYSMIIDSKFEQILGDFGADIKSLKNNLEKQIDVDLKEIVIDTYKNEGILAFYKGMSFPILSVPLINASVFTTYEFWKRFFREPDES